MTEAEHIEALRQALVKIAQRPAAEQPATVILDPWWARLFWRYLGAQAKGPR